MTEPGSNSTKCFFVRETSRADTSADSASNIVGKMSLIVNFHQTSSRPNIRDRILLPIMAQTSSFNPSSNAFTEECELLISTDRRGPFR